MKIVLAQTKTIWENREANLEKAEITIRFYSRMEPNFWILQKSIPLLSHRKNSMWRAEIP